MITLPSTQDDSPSHMQLVRLSKWEQHLCTAPLSAIRERFIMFCIGLAALFEGLLLVCSLGYLDTDLRDWLLFDVFVDE